MTASNQNDSLFVQERHARIVEHVEAHGKASVAKLCEQFGVSGATMRNDLRSLEKAGLITRAHGGAMRRTRTGLELDSIQKEVQNRDAKQAIAQAALELLDDGDTIVLDTGTTTLELARLLRDHRNLTIVTNDFAIAMALEEHADATVIFLGGTVRKRFHCTVPYGASDQHMEGLTVDKAFMGTNGFSLEDGASTPDLGTAHVKARLIRMAAKVILLCDATKHGSRSFARFATTAEIDVLVTDACSPQLESALVERGVEVIRAIKGVSS